MCIPVFELLLPDKISRMKKWMIAVACFFLLAGLRAQQTPPAEAPYLKNPYVPPFRLLKPDSTNWVTNADIKKNRQVLLIFFSPDCEHCKKETQDILAQFDKFREIEIVMATFQPFDEMKHFYEYYRIADHKNIHMGRDEKYFLPPYYRMQNLPYMALYDKKGNYITHFEGNHPVDTLMKAFAGGSAYAGKKD